MQTFAATPKAQMPVLEWMGSWYLKVWPFLDILPVNSVSAPMQFSMFILVLAFCVDILVLVWVKMKRKFAQDSLVYQRWSAMFSCAWCESYDLILKFVDGGDNWGAAVTDQVMETTGAVTKASVGFKFRFKTEEQTVACTLYLC